MSKLTPEEWLNSIELVGVVVGCIVKQDGKYLLVQEAQEKAYGLWNLPAGHVDKGESLEVAAVREAKEETGYDVELNRELAIYHEAAQKTVKHVYEAHIVAGDLLAQEGEILQVKWLTYDEVSELERVGKLRAIWVWDIINKYEKGME